MTNFTTSLLNAVARGENLDDLFCKELETAINDLLKTELTVFLDYEKYDPIGYNSGNSRNGYYQRALKTKYGEITVQVPRDRNGEFTQLTFSLISVKPAIWKQRSSNFIRKESRLLK